MLKVTQWDVHNDRLIGALSAEEKGELIDEVNEFASRWFSDNARTLPEIDDFALTVNFTENPHIDKIFSQTPDKAVKGMYALTALELLYAEDRALHSAPVERLGYDKTDVTLAFKHFPRLNDNFYYKCRLDLGSFDLKLTSAREMLTDPDHQDFSRYLARGIYDGRTIGEVRKHLQESEVLNRFISCVYEKARQRYSNFPEVCQKTYKGNLAYSLNDFFKNSDLSLDEAEKDHIFLRVNSQIPDRLYYDSLRDLRLNQTFAGEKILMVPHRDAEKIFDALRSAYAETGFSSDLYLNKKDLLNHNSMGAPDLEDLFNGVEKARQEAVLNDPDNACLKPLSEEPENVRTEQFAVSNIKALLKARFRENYPDGFSLRKDPVEFNSCILSCGDPYIVRDVQEAVRKFGSDEDRDFQEVFGCLNVTVRHSQELTEKQLAKAEVKNRPVPYLNDAKAVYVMPDYSVSSSCSELVSYFRRFKEDFAKSGDFSFFKADLKAFQKYAVFKNPDMRFAFLNHCRVYDSFKDALHEENALTADDNKKILEGNYIKKSLTSPTHEIGIQEPVKAVRGR